MPVESISDSLGYGKWSKPSKGTTSPIDGIAHFARRRHHVFGRCRKRGNFDSLRKRPLHPHSALRRHRLPARQEARQRQRQKDRHPLPRPTSYGSLRSPALLLRQPQKAHQRPSQHSPLRRRDDESHQHVAPREPQTTVHVARHLPIRGWIRSILGSHLEPRPRNVPCQSRHRRCRAVSSRVRLLRARIEITEPLAASRVFQEGRTALFKLSPNSVSY